MGNDGDGAGGSEFDDGATGGRAAGGGAAGGGAVGAVGGGAVGGGAVDGGAVCVETGSGGFTSGAAAAGGARFRHREQSSLALPGGTLRLHRTHDDIVLDTRTHPGPQGW